MKELVIAFGLLLFIEGLLYALFPSKMKNMLKTIEKMETNQLRTGGFIFALIIGLLSAYWLEDTLLGFVIALAMILNLIIAGLAGTLIPLTLNKFNIDPALASGVILTTITDVFGFLSFLGLATIVII